MTGIFRRTLSGLVATALFSVQVGLAGDTTAQISTSCVRHLNAITESDAESSTLKGFAFDHVPGGARKDANRKVAAKATTIFLLPTSATEYTALFGNGPKASGTAEIQEVHAQLAKQDPNERRRSINGKTVEDFIAKSPASILTFVGHNEGGRLKFLDGTSEDLVDLNETCRQSGKVCIFVACRSQEHVDIGLRHEVSFPEALTIASGIVAFISERKGQQVSVGEIAAHLEQVEKETRKHYKIVFLVSSVCKVAGTAASLIAVGVIVYALEDDCSDPEHPCPK